ncbi:hypothetical protein CMEL01_02967 [Colletotrichum melonis]|uniref:Ankyrin repeat protein n=1 Tax=Colletotrichum melonis TaxID=1209925 RepID=A0AAI9XUC7_9PEZI|nr:hypothetical protein CMEL01_02967 [Colletotrichum melonis]
MPSSPPFNWSSENSSGENSRSQPPGGGASLHVGAADVPLISGHVTGHDPGHIASYIAEPFETSHRFDNDLDFKDTHGGTALLYFTRHRMPQYNFIKRLIKDGASPKDPCPQKCCTPLINVVQRADLSREEDKKAIRYLARKDIANVNLDNSRYGSALNKACYDGNLEMVRFLTRECGASASFLSKGLFGSALQAACLSKADKDVICGMIQHLVGEARADINAQCGFFGTAVNIACLLQSDEPWSLILDMSRGHSNIPDPMGRLPIHFAAVFSRKRYERISQQPRLRVLPLDSKDKTGRTVLHWAAQSGDVDTVREILTSDKIKLDIDQPDNDGWTALCCAARGLTSGAKLDKMSSQGQTDIIKYLLECGADNTPIIGTAWSCQFCMDFKLCFKCYFSREKIHPGPHHDFKKSDSVFGKDLDKKALKTWMKR